MIWGCPQKLFYSYMAKTCAFHCLYNLAIRFVTRLGDNFTIKNLAPSRRKAKSKSPKKMATRIFPASFWGYRNCQGPWRQRLWMRHTVVGLPQLVRVGSCWGLYQEFLLGNPENSPAMESNSGFCHSLTCLSLPSGYD